EQGCDELGRLHVRAAVLGLAARCRQFDGAATARAGRRTRRRVAPGASAVCAGAPRVAARSARACPGAAASCAPVGIGRAAAGTVRRTSTPDADEQPETDQ